MKQLSFFIVALTLLMGLQAQEVLLPEESSRAAYVNYSELESGLWVSLEPAVAMGTIHSSMLTTMRFGIVSGYRFSQFFRVGVGVAPTFCFGANDKVDDGSVIIPVFAHFRGNVFEDESRMIAPFWSFDVGYGINDGVYLSPSIGFRAGLHRHGFVLSLGYLMQRMSGSLCESLSADKYHACMLRLGYEF